MNNTVIISITVIILLSVSLGITGLSYAEDIPYTQEDRDRLISIEVKVEEGFKSIDRRFEDLRADMNNRFESIDKRFESIDKRFESIDAQFDRMINLMIGIVLAFAGIVAVTIGFAIWDRRTMIRPFEKKVNGGIMPARPALFAGLFFKRRRGIQHSNTPTLHNSIKQYNKIDIGFNQSIIHSFWFD